MPHLGRRQFVLFLGAAARLRASETPFWNSKPPAEWSLGDKYQLVNRSPWANPVRGFFRPLESGSLSGRRPSGIPPVQVAEWGPKGVVTWESAQPLRDARQAPLPREFGNCYVIGVDGISFGGGWPGFLRHGVALVGKGKQKWTVRPVHVREVVRNSSVLLFAFPRSAAPIGLESGDVRFEAQLGRWSVETRFKPREMLYQGQLAL